MLYSMERRQTEVLPEAEGLSQPAWRFDSQGLVATGENGGLFTVMLKGDDDIKLRTPLNPPRIRWLGNGTWSRDGQRVLCEASSTATPSAGQGTWLEIF